MALSQSFAGTGIGENFDIISNNKRGKLVKRGKYDYIYNFDENGQLIFVRRSNAKACEYIKRQGNIEIGLTFRRRNKIEAVTLCEFYDDGKIKRYVYYYCESNDFAQLEEEFYKEIKSEHPVFLSHLIFFFKLQSSITLKFPKKEFKTSGESSSRPDIPNF